MLAEPLPFQTETLADQILGLNPPPRVYFVMRFEHHLDHPMNAGMNPGESSFDSEPQRTMDEARVIAQAVANDFANKRGLTVITFEGGVDEDGIDFPSYIGIDPNDLLHDEQNVVFTAMVAFEDYRNETIH